MICSLPSPVRRPSPADRYRAGARQTRAISPRRPTYDARRRPPHPGLAGIGQLLRRQLRVAGQQHHIRVRINHRVQLLVQPAVPTTTPPICSPAIPPPAVHHVDVRQRRKQHVGGDAGLHPQPHRDPLLPFHPDPVVEEPAARRPRPGGSGNGTLTTGPRTPPVPYASHSLGVPI